jgi:hypothetical protein
LRQQATKLQASSVLDLDGNLARIALVLSELGQGIQVCATAKVLAPYEGFLEPFEV